jgi:Zc3h12a-like Ribonuclease NYN domain
VAEPFYVVVDGSNLATEGRTEPSLAQLDEAVRTFAEEHPEAEIIVVVDATFAHRIAPDEREQLEQAHLHGELVWPPAGTVGRGDAFVLRIAERIGGVVLSNDSFQEFQEEHPWLFEPGRLVGGKPVPGVGWIFAKRIPVRPTRKPASSKRATSITKGPPKKPPGGYKIGATKRAAPTISAAAAMELALAPAEPAAPTKKAPSSTKAQAKKPAMKKAAEATKVEPAKEDGSARQDEPAKKSRAKKKAPADLAETTKKKATAKKAGEAKKAKKAKKAESAKKVAAPAKKEGTKKKASAEKLPRGKKEAEKAETAKKSGRAAGKGAAKAMKASAKRSARAADDDRAPGSSDLDGARRQRGGPPATVNEPLPFITFAAEHPLGSSVEGEVASFTSHGAMVDVTLPGGELLHCYVPLSRLADPPPRRAREVLRRGERRTFVLVGLDPTRRAAELGITELVGAGGHPDPEEGT